MNSTIDKIQFCFIKQKRKIQLILSTNYFKFLTNPNPTTISLPLTAQCNHRCLFCEIRGTEQKIKNEGKKYQANLLDIKDIKPFESFIKSAHSIDMGGLTALGEPFLSPNFSQVIKYLRKINQHARIQITTNAALLTEEKKKLLISSAPLDLTFSLHAISQKTYHKLMGKDFERVIKNIHFFCQKSQNNSQISKTINFGFGKHNYQDGEKIIDFAKKNKIDLVHIYPYYKSPNAITEDVSFYANPQKANLVLDKIYQKAEKIGQKLSPIKPSYISKKSPKKQSVYSGGCLHPFNSFILKADPYNKNQMALCVCNRIVLFQVNFKKTIDRSDLEWAWQHPAIKAMRQAKPGQIPLICQFCQNPKTPFLHSLNYQRYKKQRDKAVESFLKQFQFNKYSPNKSIELLSKNIYSI